MSARVDDAAQAAELIVRLKAEIEQKTEQLELLKRLFKEDDEYKVPGKYELGDYEVIVTENVRLDDTLARKELDKRTYDEVSSLKLDTRKARKLLGLTTLERITKHYEPRLEVREKK